MAKILDQSLQNNMLKEEREFFPRSTAFYYNDSLAIKISKVVFPIFILCYLVLTIKDAVDIVLSKKHFKKITPTEPAKNKSDQFISKYGTTIMAAGALVALGYAAYKFLPAQTNSTITAPFVSPKPSRIRNSIENHDITWLKNVDWKIYSSLLATTATFASTIIYLSNSSRKKSSLQPSNPAVDLANHPVKRPRSLSLPNLSRDIPIALLRPLLREDERRKNFSIQQPVKQGTRPRSLSLSDLSEDIPEAPLRPLSQLLREEEIVPQMAVGPAYDADGPVVAAVATYSPPQLNGASFESETVIVKKAYDWEDKHRLAMQQLRYQAERLGLFRLLENPAVKGAKFSYWNRGWGIPQSFLYNLQQFLMALSGNNFSYETHKHFITYFRDALLTGADYPKEIMEQLEELAYFRFTQVSFSSYLESLLYYSTTFNDENRITLQDIAEQLKGFNKEIHKNKSLNLYVEWEKLKGATNIKFDPQAEHNLPYARSWFSILVKDGHGEKYKEKFIRQLRLSTPTKGNNLGNSSTNEEFEGFLKSAQKKQEKTGYFNLQHRRSNADGERVRSIESLQGKYTYKDRETKEDKETFFVWSLPFDGKIFTLEEKVKTDGTRGELTEFARMSDDEYKDLLVSEFFKKGSSFAIPQFYWNKEESERNNLAINLRKILDDVHSLYFKGQDLSNNVAKRRSMVLLFYAHLIDFAAVEHDLDFIVTSCKDNKDRGGAMNAICEMVRMIRTNKHNDPEMLKKSLMQVLGAGLHTKNEHILENRLIFLTDLLEEVVRELTDEQIKAIQVHLFGYTDEQIFGNDDELVPKHRFFNHRKIGKVVDFNYTEDEVTTDIPFANASNNDELYSALEESAIYKGTFDQIEFSKIFATLRKNGQISPEKVYKQFGKDFARASAINKGSVALKQPNGRLEYYFTKGKEELLAKLHLPKTWNEIQENHYQELLKDPQKWNDSYISLLNLPIYWRDKSLAELIKHFELFSLITQASAGAATALFLTHPQILSFSFNDEISYELTDNSINPYFGFEVELVPSENIYKVTAKSSFCFKNNEDASNTLDKKVLVSTEFDLTTKKISYEWRIDSLNAELEPPASKPDSIAPPASEESPKLVALPAKPIQRPSNARKYPSLKPPKRGSLRESKQPDFPINPPRAALSVFPASRVLTTEEPTKIYDVTKADSIKELYQAAKNRFKTLREESGLVRPLSPQEQQNQEEKLYSLFQSQFDFLVKSLNLTPEIPENNAEYLKKLSYILDIQFKSFAIFLKIPIDRHEFQKTYLAGTHNLSIRLMGNLFAKSLRSFFNEDHELLFNILFERLGLELNSIYEKPKDINASKEFLRRAPMPNSRLAAKFAALCEAIAAKTEFKYLKKPKRKS